MVTFDFRAKALGYQAAAGYIMTIISPLVFGWVLEQVNEPMDNPIQASNWGPSFIILGLGALVTLISGIVLKKFFHTD